ncbi:PRC-barrel domain-containing protein [Acetobacter sp.]|uniref:PRC-barrel domain-containing protein n=1 Tax=Acetobacter sp. TaxID=440 RepID=UPI0025B8E3B1|nr:PRC-barrel domain-containing protein [Acetobacter sp.]MCH4090480.1 PRC-barrel domain-containing protein [Acetobacter sp.]MCI1299174.1 PRC-barrel domain-containing protein [Acetobacter sp.]MCI1315721.1 PRC-barrel domain-containing protein [Acetobacter sp.]
MNRLKSDAMDGFQSRILRAQGILRCAGLFCAVAAALVASSSGILAQVLAQSREAGQPPVDRAQQGQALDHAGHMNTVNRDAVTGDNPDLDIPDSPPPKPASGESSQESATATIEEQPLGSLIDRDVQAVAGGNLGHIVDVLIDGDGEMQAVVIDIGGFLGVGNRRVAVSSDLIQVSHADPQAPVIMQVSAAVIRSAPEYKRGDKNTSVLTGPRLLATGQPVDTSSPSSAETVSVKAPVVPAPSSPASSSGE